MSLVTCISFEEFKRLLLEKYAGKVRFREHGPIWNKLGFDDRGPTLTPVTGPQVQLQNRPVGGEAVSQDCQRCASLRVVSVTVKCSDRFCSSMFVGDKLAEYDGYVPPDLGIGGNDYIRFSYCLDCGQIQGKFPLDATEMELDAVNPMDSVEE